MDKQISHGFQVRCHSKYEKTLTTLKSQCDTSSVFSGKYC